MSELTVYKYLTNESVLPVPCCDRSLMSDACSYLQLDFAGVDRVIGPDSFVQRQGNQLWSETWVGIKRKDESDIAFQQQQNARAPNPLGNQSLISTEPKRNFPRISSSEIPTRADDILKMVLHGKMKLNEERLTPLHLACRFCPDNGKLIAKILQAKPSLAKVPFRSRIRKVSKGKLNPYVEYRPSKKRKYFTSAVSRKMSCSEMLAPDKDSYPIHIALAHNCTFEVAKLLVKQEPNILLVGDGDGLCPLSVAIGSRASEEIVQFLISMKKESVRCLDTRMNLPLHHACIKGCSMKTAKELSSAYPNAIHKMNFNGKTPLELLQSNNACSDDVYSYLQSVAFPEEDVEDIDC